MSFCNMNLGIGGSFWRDGNKRTDKRTPDGQTDMEDEIFI